MKELPELSKPEYDVLRILWKHQELSVREVHNLLAAETAWAYTTTKTVMDRMVKKQLLVRENMHGVFVYQPLVTRPRGLARLVHYFAGRVLETDHKTVVSMFAGSDAISDSELKELKALLKELDEKELNNKELNKNKPNKKASTKEQGK